MSGSSASVCGAAVMQRLTRPYAALGDRLRELREARGLTQTQLAYRVGSTQTVVSRYELGHVRPPRPRLGQLAALLGADEGELAQLAGYEC